MIRRGLSLLVLVAGLAHAGDFVGPQNATQLQGKKISTTAPSSGQVLQLAGGVWTPSTPKSAFCGDGADGAATFDGAATPAGSTKDSATHYTLTRDVFYTTVTCSYGVTIAMANYIAHANTSFTVPLGCTFDNSGPSGAAGGAATAAGSLGAGSNGGAGSTTNGSVGANVTAGKGGAGGAGGSQAVNTGAAGGTVSASGAINAAPPAVLGVVVAATNTIVRGGAGGGGGAGDANGGANSGGHGAAGAGGIIVVAPSMRVDGLIQAIGGAGQTMGVGDVGGGGGGGGGWVSLVSHTIQAYQASQGTVDASSVAAVTNGDGFSVGDRNGRILNCYFSDGGWTPPANTSTTHWALIDQNTLDFAGAINGAAWLDVSATNSADVPASTITAKTITALGDKPITLHNFKTGGAISDAGWVVNGMSGGGLAVDPMTHVLVTGGAGGAGHGNSGQAGVAGTAGYKQWVPN